MYVQHASLFMLLYLKLYCCILCRAQVCVAMIVRFVWLLRVSQTKIYTAIPAFLTAVICTVQ